MSALRRNNNNDIKLQFFLRPNIICGARNKHSIVVIIFILNNRFYEFEIETANFTA